MLAQPLAYQQKKQKKLIPKRRRKTASFMQTIASQRFDKLQGKFDTFYLQENEYTQAAKQILKNQGQMDSSYEEQYLNKSQRLITKHQKLSLSLRKNIQGWVQQQKQDSWLCQQEDNQREKNNKKIIIHKKNQKSYLLNYLHKCQEISQINQENITEPRAARKNSSKAQVKTTIVVINDPLQNKKTSCPFNGRIIKIKQRIDKIKHISVPKRNIQNNFNETNFKMTPPLHSLSYSALNFLNQPVEKAKLIKHRIHQSFTKKLQTELTNIYQHSKSVLRVLQDNNNKQSELQSKTNIKKQTAYPQKQIKSKVKQKLKQRVESQDNRINNLRLSQLIRAKNFRSLDSKNKKKKQIYKAPTYSIRQMVESYINRNIKVENSQNQNYKADMRQLLSKHKNSPSSCQKSKSNTKFCPNIKSVQPGLSEAVRKTIKTILDFKSTRDRYKTQ